MKNVPSSFPAAIAVAVLVSLGPSAPVFAEEVEPRSGSLLATGAAVFPGVIVPGVGHFVLGEREDAKRFLKLDLAGAGLAAVGFGGMALSGGSDRVAALCMIPTVLGMSMLATSWLADVLGSAHGTGEWLLPREPSGTLSVRTGYVGLFASRVDFRHGVALGATWREGAFELVPRGILGPSRSFWEFGSGLGYRLWQAEADPVTRLSIAGSVVHQRFRSDGFSSTVGEAHLDLRLNLKHLASTMRNAYALGRVGLGGQAFDYTRTAFTGSDLSPLMVLEFGGGAQVSERINVELLYRNRKDELPGGMVVPGLFDSYLGFLELQSRVVLTEQWALTGGVRWGNGLMPWISVESQVF